MPDRPHDTADLTTDPMTHHDTVVCPECGDHHPLPRDPSAYQPTDHFLQRKRDRDPPGSAIADCIRAGTVKRCDDELLRYLETTIHGEVWRVVVRFEPAVVHGSASAHRAVTIHRVEGAQRYP